MIAAIKIRSDIGASRKVRDTLRLLKLEKINNCVIMQNSKSILGMLNVVKDYVTYGEIDKETLIELLSKKLRTVDNKAVDEKTLKELTNYDNFNNFAEDLLNGKISFKELGTKFKKVFKLRPPKGGFKSIKKHYPEGDLGYRGKEINSLLKKMF
ncbi:MAG: 50S ribosomal protein L30 [Candidatus Aenigmarchaeota archaeon]|nr:50S ribosomal protein L30 [Candidatus Aenigmarchaeota archaeon]MDW8149433.1 50S ribosomal protein L30 [Candidatus Aenigmarchaeota archaeon]